MENNIIIYEDKNGIIKVTVNFNDGDIWLTQNQISSIYNVTRQNIEYHLKNIYETEELPKDTTCKEILQVQKEGNRDWNELDLSDLIIKELF